jgi:hypothetical protein
MSLPGLVAGGMVSNHRLVLFTHVLCRLSYPAVGRKVSRPGVPGLCKIAHSGEVLLGARK